MHSFHNCAVEGGEAGFSAIDGTWEAQSNYIETQMATKKAMGGVPYYGTYVNIMSLLNVASAFGVVAAM